MKRFQRKVEDFVCEHCQKKIVGNGYTNHCPNCLYSKHVDINPGDRLSDCHGLMEPIGLIKKHGTLYIIHKCQVCSKIKLNKVGPLDNRQALIELSAKPVNLKIK